MSDWPGGFRRANLAFEPERVAHSVNTLGLPHIVKIGEARDGLIGASAARIQRGQAVLDQFARAACTHAIMVWRSSSSIWIALGGGIARLFPACR
jgi:hypothetical protein